MKKHKKRGQVCQVVEYLNVSLQTMLKKVPGIFEHGDQFVLMTIRPDPLENFHLHSLALTRDQAERLMLDLQETLYHTEAVE